MFWEISVHKAPCCKAQYTLHLKAPAWSWNALTCKEKVSCSSVSTSPLTGNTISLDLRILFEPYKRHVEQLLVFKHGDLKLATLAEIITTPKNTPQEQGQQHQLHWPRDVTYSEIHVEVGKEVNVSECHLTGRPNPYITLMPIQSTANSNLEIRHCVCSKGKQQRDKINLTPRSTLFPHGRCSRIPHGIFGPL